VGLAERERQVREEGLRLLGGEYERGARIDPGLKSAEKRKF
jgi:hypothetical protein